MQGSGGEHANFYSEENGTLAGHDAECTVTVTVTEYVHII